jgi:hypothetical protein
VLVALSFAAAGRRQGNRANSLRCAAEELVEVIGAPSGEMRMPAGTGVSEGKASVAQPSRRCSLRNVPRFLFYSRKLQEFIE